MFHAETAEFVRYNIMTVKMLIFYNVQFVV